MSISKEQYLLEQGWKPQPNNSWKAPHRGAFNLSIILSTDVAVRLAQKREELRKQIHEKSVG